LNHSLFHLRIRFDVLDNDLIVQLYRSDQWWTPDPENAEKHIYLEHMKMYQVPLDTGENRASVQRQNISSYLLRAYYSSINKITYIAIIS
jgi:hypothetical protein